MSADPHFHIRRRNDADLFWSMGDGWRPLLSATKFDHAERDRVTQPVGGEWVDVPGSKITETPAPGP